MLGLWGGGNSEVRASGPPTETGCQRLSFASKARLRKISGLQSVGQDFLPEFRWEGSTGSGHDPILSQQLKSCFKDPATLGGLCCSGVVGKRIDEGL